MHQCADGVGCPRLDLVEVEIRLVELVVQLDLSAQTTELDQLVGA